MSTKHHSQDVGVQTQYNHLYDRRQEDPYQARCKPQEPTHCPDCQAIYHKGRWQWGEVVADSSALRCPACARIHDKVPAGFLVLSGEFIKSHHNEILSLIHHQENQEKQDHALERIMTIEENADGISISYTGFHLPRGTGEALRHAYQGTLDITHNERSDQIRVNWSR